jgi:CheY-like chemotaxis protein
MHSGCERRFRWAGSAPVKLTMTSVRATNKWMPRGDQTVLIVDDDPIVLAVTEERLRDLGYEVITRDQVLGTSQWIVQNRPWLMLLDVMMPAMSGSELASFLRRRGIETHIILHSSKDADELARIVENTGALGAIPKGLDDAQFVKEFKSLVRSIPAQGGFAATQS